MHVPDGFINAPVSVAAGAVAVGAVAVSLRGARRELDERTAPLAGLVAAFIFAVQMLNFPVGAGTSGHLLGGALAAILVGPYTGVLCVSVVLLMQGVLFADGGLTALGVNILDMGVVTVLVAYGIFRALDAVLPRTRGSVTGAAFVAALLSVPVSAIAFTGLYALGGTADVALGKVFAAMTGVHVLIGIGEGVITALTVGAVIAVRPDLVHAARGFAAPLSLHAVAPAAPAAPGVPTGSAAPDTLSATADGPAQPVAASAGRPGGAAGLASAASGDQRGGSAGPAVGSDAADGRTADGPAQPVAASAGRPGGSAGPAPAGSSAAADGRQPVGADAAGRPEGADAGPAAGAGSAEPVGGSGAAAAGESGRPVAGSAAAGRPGGTDARSAAAAQSGESGAAVSAGPAADAAAAAAAQPGRPDTGAGAAGQSGDVSAVRAGAPDAAAAGQPARADAGPAAGPDAVGRPGRGSAEPVLAGTAAVADPAGDAQPGAAVGGARAAARGRSTRRVWVGGLVAALACAGVVSFYASSSPDGLEKVAADNGIAEEADEHGLADSPLADYGVEDISNGRLSGGLAGVIGVGATLAVGSGVFVAVRRRRADGQDTSATATTTATATATRSAPQRSVHGKG